MSNKPEKDPYAIKLTNVRLSYPQLFKPKAFGASSEGTPKFSASFILDKVKDAAQIKAVEAIIATITKEKFKGKKLPADKVALKDGETKADTDGYGDGIMFVSASNDKKPQVVGLNPKNVLTEADDLVYGGCYVNAYVRFWAQDNQWGKRINASLEVVQQSRPGERFGAAPIAAESVMDELEDEEDPLLA